METPTTVLPRVRRRLTAVLFGTVAVGRTGGYAALTVIALVADEVMGRPSLSGLPAAAMITGTAVAATVLSRWMARRGRRSGLTLGYGAAALGAALAVLAIAQTWFALFLVGVFVLGAGNAAALQARFAATDVHPPERRTSVLSFVLWASTIGAVAGPGLVDPAARIVEAVGLPGLGGALSAAAIAFLLAAVLCTVALRPDPSEVSEDRPTIPSGPIPSGGGSLRAAWAVPRTRVALTVMVASHFVMVLIMTMTPIALRHAGQDLGAVSLVMSAHIVGMYALSPIAGRVADRFGHRRAIGVGLTLLMAAGLTASLAPTSNQYALAAALFLLGLGWSFGFIAGSGLLTEGASYAERARLQGSADTLVFAAAAVASIGSGFLLTSVGYVALCLLGAAIVGAPVLLVLRHRGALRPAAHTA